MTKFSAAVIAIFLVFIAGAYFVKHKYGFDQVADDSVSLSGISRSAIPTTVAAITYSNDGFNPATLTIKKGQSVIFNNISTDSLRPISEPINGVESEVKIPSSLRPGETYKCTLNQTGTWIYYDESDPSKKGEIIVE